MQGFQILSAQPFQMQVGRATDLLPKHLRLELEDLLRIIPVGEFHLPHPLPEDLRGSGDAHGGEHHPQPGPFLFGLAPAPESVRGWVELQRCDRYPLHGIFGWVIDKQGAIHLHLFWREVLQDVDLDHFMGVQHVHPI